MPPEDKDIPLTRAVGRFFGHLWKAAANPVEPEPPTTQKVRESHQEQPAEIDGKPVILRRTTVEEIEFPNDKQW
ncbi:MAG: hypothetical protein AB8F26_07210 [Phycisphaerales bacterium]